MPIPAPVAEESDKEFLTRCMDDDVMKEEFPESDQRLAVCSVQAKYDANEDLLAFAVSVAKSAESHAANLIKEGKTTESDSWSSPSSELQNTYLDDHSWEDFGNWFLGRNMDADDETLARYEFPFSNDFERVNRKGLIAIRQRAAEFEHTEIFDAAGRLLDLYDSDVSTNSALATCFFSGSPMSKYGTHGSTGFKGDYAQAWRIHFSQVGGGKITPKAGGPLRGTVRRVAMIAGSMKPGCEVKSSEGMKPRGGGKSPLPGSFPSSPSDYGLNKWAKPSDDELTREDIGLTCQDLNVIKAAAIAEIKWRAAQREKQEASSKTQRISFQRKTRKKKGRYLVDHKAGQMNDVSLLQVGEAKGHGMWIDQESLETALEILDGTTLPAYVTHNGAMESDRLLSEVGVFSGFYLEEGKVKAEKFKALDSFMADESERYRRLFDLAQAMPDAFGLSLVFEADLVWVQDDGQEVPIEEGSPENSLRDLPSVRFLSIKSADFVDAPAANDGGLFSTNAKTNLILEDPQMAADIITEEVTTQPEEAKEEIQLEEAQEEESMEQKMAKKIEELEARLEEQSTQITELQGSLEASETKAEKLSALVSGQDALAEGDDSGPGVSIIEQFSQATAGEKTRIWKQKKTQILDAYRRA